MNLKREYLRLRGHGWRASEAWRAARINAAFDGAEGEELVKLAHEPDCEGYDASYVDTWDHLSKVQRAKVKEEILERAANEGTFGIVGYYRPTPEREWILVDSVWGFIGDDTEDSGYDADIKSACLHELDQARQREANALAERATYAWVAS